MYWDCYIRSCLVIQVKEIRKNNHPVPTSPILDTLDMTSLTGIEKSLTSSGLMNKDLNKLTLLEAKRIEIAYWGVIESIRRGVGNILEIV